MSGQHTSAPAVALRGPLAAEDQARANFYALLGRLYGSAPDAALLQAIAAAEELPVAAREGPGRELAEVWRALIAASAAMDAEAASQEYVDLFVGVGKSEVSLHASAYLAPAGGSVLAEIRSELARLGLRRQAGASIYEDHLAAICETMRVLIAGAPGVEAPPLAEQRKFFATYVSPWVPTCCIAITAAAIANYYRRVAEFTTLFVAIERDSFAIE
ncbi:MAG TPA: molecular chaperone TorD family protein [Casimicrobiaceae bacterium]